MRTLHLVRRKIPTRPHLVSVVAHASADTERGETVKLVKKRMLVAKSPHNIDRQMGYMPTGIGMMGTTKEQAPR